MSQAAAPSVLFVCGRNAIRSPMAEALWRRRFGAGCEVSSCGLSPASAPDPFMVAVMMELGEDLSEFESRNLLECADMTAELVISLAPGIDPAARAYAADRHAAFLAWPVADPTYASGSRNQIMEAYRDCRDLLIRRIDAWRADEAVA